MADLDPAVAKSFFTSLYEDHPVIPNTPNFDKMATRLVAKLGPNVSTGDQALQSLMFNYILSDPNNVAAGQALSSVLGNIKQIAVADFAAKFPNADLDTLINTAKASGYDVQVLNP